jgi:hypothetical protein
MHSTTARPGHRPGDAQEFAGISRPLMNNPDQHTTTITMMVSMNTKKQQTTNERLRALVEASGLTQAEALAMFNKPLGPAGYSLDYWKGFFCDPASKRFKPLRPDLLAHAEKVFARLANGR